VGGLPGPGHTLGGRALPADPLRSPPELHVLRVFTGAAGEQGNPLGIFLEGREVPAGARQGIATELGYSETVFVDDSDRGEIQLFTPAAEIPFAGHPTVGTAWLLAREGRPVEVLRPPPGAVDVRYGEELTYVAAPAEWCPPFEYVEHQDPAAIEALDPAGATTDTYHWAWLDRDAGLIRARGFYPGWGTGEDEATGSAALALCVELDRAIEVRQGRGSVIQARPLGGGCAEIGGRVALDEVRRR
jgi:predicted PhzF superfamily epimerase YddE/YHI9